MNISVFDLFKIGIGPSSSHTMGPMLAAFDFVERLQGLGLLASTARVHIELLGSLGSTGVGHGSGAAVIMGLEGCVPQTIEPNYMQSRLDEIKQQASLSLLGQYAVSFNEETDLLYIHTPLPQHPNGMRFSVRDGAGIELYRREYFSIGGGFILDEDTIVDAKQAVTPDSELQLPYTFDTMGELLTHCDASQRSIAQVMMANEMRRLPELQVRSDLLAIWKAMQSCVQRGCEQEGILPGGLDVKRRAPELYKKLSANAEGSFQKSFQASFQVNPQANPQDSPQENSHPQTRLNGDGLLQDPLVAVDWVNLYALAVNEENAAGGRVVTAPTNGAAGIVPAVLHYYMQYHNGANDNGVVDFLLSAAAIGMLCKHNASISGAEVGCQGEVGSACAMAAAGLAAVSGGTPAQIENAAEIAIEHNLGLTCDPIAGLVQIPCIERNAMASMKAINACRLALNGNGEHFVSLDKAIRTMRDTGADMKSKYKETSQGGLAVNVIEC